jgi:hypothetical protein
MEPNTDCIEITLGGQKRNLKFNMRALEALSDLKCASDIGVTSSAMIIYAGLIGWYFVKQQTPDFTFEDVSEWVEELIINEDMDGIKAVNECFLASRAFKFSLGMQKKREQEEQKDEIPEPTGMQTEPDCIEITLGGQKRTMDVSLNTWDMARKRLGVSWAKLSARFSGNEAISTFRTLVTCGIVANDRNNDRPDSVTEDQVTEWLMSNSGELIAISEAVKKSSLAIAAKQVLTN